MNKRMISSLLAAGMMVSICGISAQAAEEPFRFADEGTCSAWSWAMPYIYRAYDSGIFSGDTNGCFNASKNLSRAEAVTALLGLKGVETDTSIDVSGFADADGSWYTPYVAEAKNQGITSGYDEDGVLCFHPTSNVTRAEFITMLLKAIGEEADPSVTSAGFADADGYWYTPYVAKAKELGLTAGTLVNGKYYFYPDSYITRAEAAAMVTAVNRSTRLFSSAASAVRSGACGRTLTWTLYDNGTLYISGYGDMNDYSFDDPAPWSPDPGVIPDDEEGTADDTDRITAVVMDDGITGIGDYAFAWCSDLTAIDIPDSVQQIGIDAFESCSSLTEIVIPDGVTAIGDMTFMGCEALSRITIPDSVAEIGDSAFEQCGSLTAVALPDGLTTINDSAFFMCSELTDINIPGSVTAIKDYAFFYCTGLTGISIPEGVSEIGSGAFMLCSGLTSVSLPESLTVIGSSAFRCCDALTDVNYAGTEAQWKQITLDTTEDGSSLPDSAVIHYNT